MTSTDSKQSTKSVQEEERHAAVEEWSARVDIEQKKRSQLNAGCYLRGKHIALHGRRIRADHRLYSTLAELIVNYEYESDPESSSEKPGTRFEEFQSKWRSVTKNLSNKDDLDAIEHERWFVSQANTRLLSADVAMLSVPDPAMYKASQGGSTKQRLLRKHNIYSPFNQDNILRARLKVERTTGRPRGAGNDNLLQMVIRSARKTNAEDNKLKIEEGYDGDHDEEDQTLKAAHKLEVDNESDNESGDIAMA